MRARVAWLLMTIACAHCHGALAQEGGDPMVPPALNKSEPPRNAKGLGDLFGSVGKGLGAMWGSAPDTPMLTRLVPGPYQPSNEALGEERDVESQRIDNLGLVPLKAYQEQANQIYGQLKEVSLQTGLPGSVYLLASSELKATSTADGNVFISIGWVRSLASEDELAALLAHELSHVLLHHHDSTVFSRAQKQIQFLLAGAATLKNQLDKAKQSGSGELTQGQTKSLQRMQLLIEFTDVVALPAWTRSQELDADRLAADLLRKTGYSVVGLTEFIDHVSTWEAQQDDQRKKDEAEVQLNVQALVSEGKLDAALTVGLTNAGQNFRRTLMTEHDGADKRREELSMYLDKHHADMPRVAMRRQPYQTLLARKDVKPTLVAYAQIFDAMAKLKGGKTDEALRLLVDVTRPGGAAAKHSLPNYQLYRALREQGKQADAMKQLERSFEAGEPNWRPFEEAVRVLARSGQRERALQVAEDAKKRFRNAPALTPQLVGIYTELGFQEQAQAALAHCFLAHVSYREACVSRSKPQ